MQINREIIEKFNPCADRWYNALKYYPTFNSHFDDFIELDTLVIVIKYG